MIASPITAEIVDIRRFVREDNLASYAGLCKREYKTGKMRKKFQTIFSIGD